MPETFQKLPSESNERSFFSYVLTALGYVAQRVDLTPESKITAQEEFFTGGLDNIDSGAGIQITATPTPLLKGVTVRARAGNSTGIVAVGTSEDVTYASAPATDGFELAAGEQVFIPVDDLSKVWLIGSANDLEISWIAS